VFFFIAILVRVRGDWLFIEKLASSPSGKYPSAMWLPLLTPYRYVGP
jgi:hypothetical protein